MTDYFSSTSCRIYLESYQRHLWKKFQILKKAESSNWSFDNYLLLRFRAFRAFKIIRMALFEVYEFPKLISQKVQVTEKNSHIVATYLKNYFVKSTV